MDKGAGEMATTFVKQLFGDVWQAIRGALTSKKALTTIASIGTGLFARLGLDIPTEEILPILSPAMAYILGQGIADHGKERAKIDSGNRVRDQS